VTTVKPSFAFYLPSSFLAISGKCDNSPTIPKTKNTIKKNNTTGWFEVHTTKPEVPGSNPGGE
jgi:hypothetical protein